MNPPPPPCARTHTHTHTTRTHTAFRAAPRVAATDAPSHCEPQTKYENSAEQVNNLTNNLSGISEELDDVKNQMDDRGNSMTDTSPVVKMKKALVQVKGDTKQMDLRIGVVQHVLSHAKLSGTNAELASWDTGNDDIDD